MSGIQGPGWAGTVNRELVGERSATRADLRRISWLTLGALGDDPRAVRWALAHLAVLDADERDDAWATAFVAVRLARAIVVTSPDGRLVGLRRPRPRPGAA